MRQNRRGKGPDGITRGEVALHPGHVFVPRGDVALTRALMARGALRVVTRLHGRNEQIGVAALPEAVEAARAEVEASAGRRAVARERGRERRERLEEGFRIAFEREVRRHFPAIPDEDCRGVVERSCEVSSGRVGRTAAAKDLSPEPIRLAVIAWIRHAHTDYDARLRRAGLGQRFGRASADDRKAARKAIRGQLDLVLARWSGAPAPPDAPGPAPEPGPEPLPEPGRPAAKPRRLWERPLG